MKKVPFSKFQNGLEGVSLFLLGYQGFYLMMGWDSIPNKIPTHFNAAGIPDGWGGKGTLLTLLGICLLIYLLITVVLFVPKMWNVPVTITAANEQFVYGNMSRMLSTIKLSITGCFTYINIRSAQGGSLGAWFMIIFLLAMFGSMAYYILRTVRGAKKFQ
ncbi:DUF1648 domain-containing protein [Marasmitruncus massiliensis]|uniref:DUF1648 domain-containing protein n=1 Tax=Marasmitruncus massiliensis TaxID=1944642 RepID=UPI000C7C25EF|nr:DUF1648 domain-containing protein [Marasmitruncus massiliensis]